MVSRRRMNGRTGWGLSLERVDRADLHLIEFGCRRPLGAKVLDKTPNSASISVRTFRETIMSAFRMNALAQTRKNFSGSIRRAMVAQDGSNESSIEIWKLGLHLLL